MNVVTVRIEWEGDGNEVSVAGEFNGWVTVPLTKVASIWAADIPMEPGCYTYKFLVDGEWVTKPGDELEEDEKGNVNGILIVEEDYEVETEKVEDEKDISKMGEDLDVLTLCIDSETVKEMTKEDVKVAHMKDEATAEEQKVVINKCDVPVVSDIKEETKDEGVKELEEQKVEKSDLQNVEKSNLTFVESQDENVNPTESVNTPKINQDVSASKVSTPNVGTPKVSTPTLRSGKVTKASKLHPDDVESPRRVTRNLLAKLNPNH